QDQILGMITAGNSLTHNVPGNIFVKSADQISSEDRVLFESVAKIIIKDTKGSLSEQIITNYERKLLLPLLDLKAIVPAENEKNLTLPPDLLFFNSTGGFTADGKEYKIITDKNATTPAPWSNIIANPTLGTVVSES